MGRPLFTLNIATSRLLIYLKWFLRLTRLHIPNGISIGSVPFAALAVVTDNRPTDRQTTLLRL